MQPSRSALLFPFLLGALAPGSAAQWPSNPAANLALAGSAWAGPGVPAVVALPVPLRAEFAGMVLYAQGAMVDQVAVQGVVLGLTAGARLRLGH